MWDIDLNRPPGDQIREVPDKPPRAIRYQPSHPLYERPPAVDTAAARVDSPTQWLPVVQRPTEPAASPLFATADHPAAVVAVVADELAAAEDGARRWAQALADMRAGLIVLHRDALARLAQITGSA